MSECDHVDQADPTAHPTALPRSERINQDRLRAEQAPSYATTGMAAVRHLPSVFRGQKQPGHTEPARQLLFHDFGEIDTVNRLERIALIGLRGADKSTLGSALTRRLGVPFVELDRLIEEQNGPKSSR